YRSERLRDGSLHKRKAKVTLRQITPTYNIKRSATVSTENHVLTEEHFKNIQQIVDVVLPRDIERILSSMCLSLTADQWKHWTCIYSMLTLKDKLPSQHYCMKCLCFCM
ncbi:hypothetical protein MAR_015117, partial [Mya arenaria]